MKFTRTCIRPILTTAFSSSQSSCSPLTNTRCYINNSLFLTTASLSLPNPSRFLPSSLSSLRLSSSSTMASPAPPPPPQRRFQNPSLFICDIQTAFAKTIHQFPLVLSTTCKLIRFASALQIPIYVTTQNRSRLGDTVPELGSIIPPRLVRADLDKTKFSMFLPEISSALAPGSEICLVGIESHICVTQTALDLLEAGHRVYVIADAVSSSNKEEVPIALERLRRAGAVVTSSESWMYECMGDAGLPEFKEVIKLVKDTAEGTRAGLQGLVGSKI